MEIMITNQGEKNGTHYFTMNDGKREVEIMIITGETYLEPVRVINRNSASRAWNPRGAVGKGFDSIEAAVANYKTPAIKEMINHAATLVQA